MAYYAESQVLWATAVITVCYQLLFYVIASWNRFDKVTDFAGGSNFAINAIVAIALGGVPSSKRIVATVCVCLWAARLSTFLLVRVLKAGEDKRFDEMRGQPLKFLGFWIFQIIWVWNVGLPVTLLNAGPDTSEFGSRAGDIIGLIIWLVGFVIEAVSDQHKFLHRFGEAARFKREHPDKTVPVLSSGLWHFSRQPNYFGEIFLWWGMFILCLPSDPSVSGGMAYASLVSPLLTTLLLLFLSGIPLAEQNYQKRYLSADNKDVEARAGFIEYRRRTSPLIPLPTSAYLALPMWVKRTFLFEFKMYETELWREAVGGAPASATAVSPSASAGSSKPDSSSPLKESDVGK